MKKTIAPPPFDSAHADRQMALRMAHARYRNAPANTPQKDEAWTIYRDLLQASLDRGDGR